MESDPRYENAVIYTIKTKNGIYVGSTVDFGRRESNHKWKLKNDVKSKLYNNIRSNSGWYKIEILKMFPCSNKAELNIEERKVCEELNANLNTNIPYTTPEEKKVYHKGYLKEYNKTYLKKRVICECGVELGRVSLSRHLKTKSHHDAMKELITDDLLGFLTCKPCENVVITNTNNSHTTPYPSSDEEDF